jgi:hypothetical protein
MPSICAIFCNPPIAIARLGESPTPLASYGWQQPENPRTLGETILVPRWTLEVLPDGSVQPMLPDDIRFRDGAMIRPVCPFIELWAWVGEPAAEEASWRAQPLTEALLAEHGGSKGDIRVTVTLRNLKASRRTQNPALAFGTFPPVTFSGDDHAPKPLEGRSPPGATPPMIPTDRSIPMGSIQMLRPRPQPQPSPENRWTGEVDISALRLRFTPPAGHCYGPNVADAVLRDPAVADPRLAMAVPRSRAFLDSAAGWHNVSRDPERLLAPDDTVDLVAGTRNSLGVVDDTSEGLIEIALALPGKDPLGCRANIWVGPPDFAPDRRPFYTLADELNDLSAGAAARNQALSDEDLENWIADLFERIYETVELFNVDAARFNNRRLAELPPERLGPPVAGDQVPEPRRPMGGEDRLRSRDYAVGAPSDQVPLPLTRHARERHRALSDVQALRNFVASNPNRLPTLVRGPFESELVGTEAEGLRETTMRMPPFMAQSTPRAPLSLAAWQYELLMRWHELALQPSPFGLLMGISEEAETARAEALGRAASAVLDW